MYISLYYNVEEEKSIFYEIIHHYISSLLNKCPLVIFLKSSRLLSKNLRIQSLYLHHWGVSLYNSEEEVVYYVKQTSSSTAAPLNLQFIKALVKT